MAAAAFIAQTLDPLVTPQCAEQDHAYEKVFGRLNDDAHCRDYLRGFKRQSTYAVDWAGDKLLIATKENALRLFDPERGNADEERSWSGEWMSMQCDPNNPHIAAAVTWSGKFRVFDTRAANTYLFDVDLKKTSTNMKEFLVLCWSPDSKTIAVNNRSDQVYLFDLSQGSLRLGPTKHMQHEVNQMVWTKDGEALWIATGGPKGMIHAFPAPSMQSEGANVVVAHQYTTISLAADPTGKHIASGGGDCLVTLWDQQHMICTRTFGFATQAVTTLGFNHTGELLAWGTGGSGSSGGERNLTIAGANTGNMYWQDATPAPVQQVRWHPKKNVLAYTLNAAQLPDDRRTSNREQAVVHILKIPER